MTSLKTCKFFSDGTSNQFDWMLSQYDKCLTLKAHNKSNKPENVIKLDKWYQNDLPKKIKSRGKDAHLVHEEIVQTIKWKLARGKFRPNLLNMVRMNTPRVVMQETKKAFRKIAKNQDIQSAITSLCTLKGVGPAMASAILSAGAPEIAPYMADECLLSMPDVDCLDYTVREYMSFVEFVKDVVDRLNTEHGSNYWDPHKVELAVWSHYIANDLKPEMLEDMPSSTKKNGSSSATHASEAAEENGEQKQNGDETANTNGATEEKTNGDSVENKTSDDDDDNNKEEEDKESAKNGDSVATPEEAPKEETPKEPEPEKINGEQEKKENGASQESAEKTDNGNTGVNGKEIPSSTDSESTNDSTMNNLEAEDTNTNDSTKENVDSSSTTTTTSSSSVTKRPLEEESPATTTEDSAEPSAKKQKEDATEAETSTA